MKRESATSASSVVVQAKWNKKTHPTKVAQPYTEAAAEEVPAHPALYPPSMTQAGLRIMGYGITKNIRQTP